MLRGTGGTLLLNKYVGDMFGGWSANGRTYAVDFLANKKWEMLYSLREGFVLLNSEGNVIWNNPQVAVNNLRPGLCDIDSDGALELLQLGAGLRAIDSATGMIEWTLLGVGEIIEPVTVDINSDKRDEVMVVANFHEALSDPCYNQVIV
ncbi:TPA: hypothetical protein EYO63_05720 [Candidatus Poribacteria bacterium]|nr:hypothetical protein [Candidatus Poribacteria bacterium]